MKCIGLTTLVLLSFLSIQFAETADEIESTERSVDFDDVGMNDLDNFASEEDKAQQMHGDVISDKMVTDDSVMDLEFRQKVKKQCADGSGGRCGYFRYGKKKDGMPMRMPEKKSNDLRRKAFLKKRENIGCADKSGGRCGYFRYGKKKKELLKDLRKQKMKRVSFDNEKRLVPPIRCLYFIGGRCGSHRYGRKKKDSLKTKDSKAKRMSSAVYKKMNDLPEMVEIAHKKRSALARPPGGFMRCLHYGGGGCGSYRYGRKKEMQVPR